MEEAIEEILNKLGKIEDSIRSLEKKLVALQHVLLEIKNKKKSNESKAKNCQKGRKPERQGENFRVKKTEYN